MYKVGKYFKCEKKKKLEKRCEGQNLGDQIPLLQGHKKNGH